MLPFLEKNKTKSIKVNDIDVLLGKINLIDVRNTDEYSSGHIPTAKNIPMDKLVNSAHKYLDRNKEYYIVCQSGGRSSKTCDSLSSEGYNVVNVEGGTGAYTKSLES